MNEGKENNILIWNKHGNETNITRVVMVVRMLSKQLICYWSPAEAVTRSRTGQVNLLIYTPVTNCEKATHCIRDQVKRNRQGRVIQGHANETISAIFLQKVRIPLLKSSIADLCRYFHEYPCAVTDRF